LIHFSKIYFSFFFLNFQKQKQQQNKNKIRNLLKEKFNQDLNHILQLDLWNWMNVKLVSFIFFFFLKKILDSNL